VSDTRVHQETESSTIAVRQESSFSLWLRSWQALTIITVVGAALRLVGLSRQSYWLDEGASLDYIQVHNSAWGIIDSLAHGGDNHPPLHFLALFFMNQMFDITNEAAMRFPSVIASVALIPAAWMLATVVAPRWKWLAASLVAVSPFLIWYAQEARMYAMAEAFAAWSIVGFFKYLQTGERRWLRLHAVCRVLGFYTHVYAVLLCVAELALLPALPNDKRRQILRTMALEFALMLPWFVVLYGVRGNTAGTDTGSPAVAAAYTFFVFVFGYSFGPGVRDLHISHHLSSGVMAQLAIAAVIALGLAYAIWSSRSNKWLRQLAVVVAVPMVLAIGVTLTTSVSLNARYISIMYVPFVCILTMAIGKYWSKNAVKAATIGLVCVIGVSLVNYWSDPTYEKDDYRSAMQYIHATGSTDPILVMTYPQPAELYANIHDAVVNLAPNSLGAKNWQALRQSGLEADDVWILQARSWETDSDGSHLRALLQKGTITDDKRFAGVRLVHLAVAAPNDPVRL
jgi:uncharacterized membrane protein